MRRFTVLLFSCAALTGGAWLAHVVWGQTAETTEEKKVTLTKSEYQRLVAVEVAKAVAAEREKAGHEKPATDEQVLKPDNWHIARFNKAEYVIYTGPGQAMFHHWLQTQTDKPPMPRSSGGLAPPSK